MRWFCLMFVLSQFNAIGAWANNVVIRTAEHRDFTRVAFDLVNPEQVEFENANGSIQIKLPSGTSSINSANFFKRISRDRVQSFSEEKETNTIAIELNCICVLESFIAGRSTFVLDISDPEVGTTTAETPSEWSMSNRTSKVNLGFGNIDETPLGVDQLDLADPAAQTSQRSIKPTPNVFSGDKRENLSRSRLFDALDQAVTTNQRALIVPVEGAGMEQIAFRSLPVIQENAQMQIEQNIEDTLSQCDDLKMLNPSNWPEYDDASKHLGLIRNQIADRFEVFQDDTSRQLAFSYMSLAMGAEANAILRTIENPTKIDLKLIEISNFIDGNHAVLPEVWFEGVQGCSDAIIWQILRKVSLEGSDQHVLPLSDDDFQKARAQFDSWPAALQGVFASRLATALVSRDSRDTALFTLRKSNEEPSLRSGERDIVEMNVTYDEEEIEGRKHALKPIIHADSDAAPEAVISLAAIAVEEGENLSSSNLEALEAYQVELRGTELEPELLRARLIASLASEDFEEAISLTRDYSQLVRPSKLNLVLDELGAAIHDIENDTVFLKEAVSLPSDFFNKFAQNVQTQIKERITFLGFGELATQLGNSITRNGPIAKPIGNDATDSDVAKAQSEVNGLEDVVVTRTAREQPLGGAAAQTPETLEELLVQAPLASAITQTKDVLNSMAKLNEELSQLGL